MGWSHCGTDSKGRDIGYGISATCDHPGCNAKIHRGLSYACGGMHSRYTAREGWEVCDGYFCEDHLVYAEPLGEDGPAERVCEACEKQLMDDFAEERAAQVAPEARTTTPSPSVGGSATSELAEQASRATEPNPSEHFR